MILGTSKISLNLGPINGHFWASGPCISGFSYTKIARTMLESFWEHLGKYYFYFLELQRNLKIGPTKHIFFWFFCPPTPNKIGISKRFQRFFRWWNLGILGQSYVWNYWNISKSYWIKNVFQMVTYHSSKNLSPRTFLVFRENHGFEMFSPHTFLVSMENPLFEL